MIAMILAGLFIGPGIHIWRHHRQQSARLATISHQNAVFQALADYWALHGCLPWPSSLGGEQQGVSQRPVSAGFYRGMIPYRTLGLSHRLARDGWGQWMVYWVDSVMTTPGMQYQDLWCRTCFAQSSFLDVIDDGVSVQEGLKNSPQNHRSMTGGSSMNARPRMDGVAVILLGDPSGHCLTNDIASPATDTSPRMDTGPVVVIRPDTTLSSARRVVQWKTRSQMFSLIGVRCVDSFFASSAPTVDRSALPRPLAQTSATSSDNVEMRPIQQP
jgi:hypothetical protein